mgnify:CR=1 FL=1
MVSACVMRPSPAEAAVFGEGKPRLCAVIVPINFRLTADDFAAWGWRIPFLLSIILLAISLWMRLKLSESPVFKAMKEAGETAANPFVESFTYPGNGKRLFVALFGIAAGLTVIWYTSMFSVLSFLSGPMRLDPTAAQLITGGSALIGMGFFLFFGHLSDRIGRKIPIVAGYALTLVLLFPLFWVIGSAANPELAKAARRAPVVVSGPQCGYDPFAAKQADECGKLLDHFSKKGVAYTTTRAPAVTVSIGVATLVMVGRAEAAPAQEPLPTRAPARGRKDGLRSCGEPPVAGRV